MKSLVGSIFALSACLPTILASPAPTRSLSQRSTETCEQYGSITTGSYILYNDLWGEAEATSGSQCTTLESLSGSTIKWVTDWTWEGGSSDVKSYANVVVEFTAAKLDDISSIDTTWDWSYSGSDIVADVSYDTFLGTSTSTSDGSTYEVMIWLAALGGAGPISSTGSTIATPTIGGYSWKLYSGLNGDTTVYSFVASSEITSFSGNLMEFYDYLEDYEGVSSSLYLQSVGAGTEAFTGSDAVFTTSAYSITVDE